MAWVSALGATIIQPQGRKAMFIRASEKLEQALGKINIQKVDAWLAEFRGSAECEELRLAALGQMRTDRATLWNHQSCHFLP